VNRHSSSGRIRHRALAKTLVFVLAATVISPFMATVASTSPANASTCNADGINFPAQGSAGFGGGTGEAGTPWLICSEAQLQGISTSASTLDGNYLLSSDIDLAAANWTPIGAIFTGVFDGNNYTISDIDGTSALGTAVFGLFDTISGSGTKVENLNLSGSFVSTFPTGDNFNSDQTVGILAGQVLSSAVVKNINVTSASFSGLVRYVGGAVGLASGGQVSVVRVTNLELVIPFRSSRAQLGGVIGGAHNATTMSRLSSSGEINGTSSQALYNDFSVGGVVGFMQQTSTLAQSASYVDWSHSGGSPSISTTFHLGGIVGSISNSSVSNSLAVSTVSGLRYFSGVVGSANSSSSLSNNLSAITPSSMTDSSPSIRVYQGTQLRSFFNQQTWGDNTIPEGDVVAGAMATSTANLQTLATYQAQTWSIADSSSPSVTGDWLLTGSSPTHPIWRLTEGNYPSLVWMDFFPTPPPVTLKANYPSGPVDQSITSGIAPSPDLSSTYLRTGFYLTGWNTEIDGAGQHFYADDAHSALAGNVLYAQWAVIPGSESLLYRDLNVPIDMTSSGVLAGTTIHASAFERYLDTGIRSSVAVTPEEYVYRITTTENDPETSVDVQSLASHDPLTIAEQDLWYGQITPGGDPAAYEFSWVAFLCLEGESLTERLSKPTSLSWSYASREDGLYGDSDQFMDSAYSNFFRNTEGGHSPDSPSTRTAIADAPLPVSENGDSRTPKPYKGQAFYVTIADQSYWDLAFLGVMDVDGQCAGETDFLAAMPILDTVNPVTDGNPNFLVAKSFEVPETFKLWDQYLGDNGTAVEFPSSQTLVGVTGRTVVPVSNAALWGLAKIGASAPTTTSNQNLFPGVSVIQVSPNSITPNKKSTVEVSGQNLDLVTSVKQGSRFLKFSRAANGNLLVHIPKLAVGKYNLRFNAKGSSPVLVKAALTVEAMPGTVSVLRFNNFQADRSELPRAAIRGLKSEITGNSPISSVICTGYTSGTVKSAAARALANQRAKRACELVSRLSPGATTVLNVKPAQGIGSSFRGIRVRIQFD